MLGGVDKIIMDEQILCRKSRKEETDRLKDLWEIAFGDDRAYIDLFFKYKYKEDRTYVLTRNGKIAAMTTAVPVLYNDKNGSAEGVMLYAVATHPEDRGKGFSTMLMDYVNRDFFEKGTFLSVLVPATPSLFQFYKNRGYTESFTISEEKVKSEDLKNCKNPDLFMQPAEGKDYNRIRNRLLSDISFIQYFDEDIEFQKQISLLSGGDIFLLRTEDIIGCAAVEKTSSEQILVKELLVPDSLKIAALWEIADFMKASEIIVRTPSRSGEDPNNGRPFGMAKAKDRTFGTIQNGYLGLAFD
ncbi:MAG: GNAT family N-acetyltransferase [Clostridia bacterium]|jgi:GNAT superfamily N-acetyltransferase